MVGVVHKIEPSGLYEHYRIALSRMGTHIGKIAAKHGINDQLYWVGQRNTHRILPATTQNSCARHPGPTVAGPNVRRAGGPSATAPASPGGRAPARAGSRTSPRNALSKPGNVNEKVRRAQSPGVEARTARTLVREEETADEAQEAAEAHARAQLDLRGVRHVCIQRP